MLKALSKVFRHPNGGRRNSPDDGYTYNNADVMPGTSPYRSFDNARAATQNGAAGWDSHHQQHQHDTTAKPKRRGKWHGTFRHSSQALVKDQSQRHYDTAGAPRDGRRRGATPRASPAAVAAAVAAVGGRMSAEYWAKDAVPAFTSKRTSSSFGKSATSYVPVSRSDGTYPLTQENLEWHVRTLPPMKESKYARVMRYVLVQQQNIPPPSEEGDYDEERQNTELRTNPDNSLLLSGELPPDQEVNAELYMARRELKEMRKQQLQHEDDKQNKEKDGFSHSPQNANYIHPGLRMVQTKADDQQQQQQPSSPRLQKIQSPELSAPRDGFAAQIERPYSQNLDELPPTANSEQHINNSIAHKRNDEDDDNVPLKNIQTPVRGTPLSYPISPASSMLINNGSNIHASVRGHLSPIVAQYSTARRASGMSYDSGVLQKISHSPVMPRNMQQHNGGHSPLNQAGEEPSPTRTNQASHFENSKNHPEDMASEARNLVNAKENADDDDKPLVMLANSSMNSALRQSAGVQQDRINDGPGNLEQEKSESEEEDNKPLCQLTNEKRSVELTVHSSPKINTSLPAQNTNGSDDGDRKESLPANSGGAEDKPDTDSDTPLALNTHAQHNANLTQNSPKQPVTPVSFLSSRGVPKIAPQGSKNGSVIINGSVVDGDKNAGDDDDDDDDDQPLLPPPTQPWLENESAPVHINTARRPSNERPRGDMGSPVRSPTHVSLRQSIDALRETYAAAQSAQQSRHTMEVKSLAPSLNQSIKDDNTTVSGKSRWRPRWSLKPLRKQLGVATSKLAINDKEATKSTQTLPNPIAKYADGSFSTKTGGADMENRTDQVRLGTSDLLDRSNNVMSSSGTLGQIKSNTYLPNHNGVPDYNRRNTFSVDHLDTMVQNTPKSYNRGPQIPESKYQHHIVDLKGEDKRRASLKRSSRFFRIGRSIINNVKQLPSKIE
ncbi:hypothetical protein H4219_005410 [Mycoemilia scoparia]|uniref:Uncharacterized protein n=1 Tax=Mycoemilia scoparia TaxID=417184 RepID=A0A9W8DPK5_9FUNG|nr:hypothetical protein H4219_005410 [Mycoemilia scoparia]